MDYQTILEAKLKCLEVAQKVSHTISELIANTKDLMTLLNIETNEEKDPIISDDSEKNIYTYPIISS